MYCSMTVSGIAKFAALLFSGTDLSVSHPGNQEDFRCTKFKLIQERYSWFQCHREDRVILEVLDPHLDSLNRTPCMKSGQNPQIQGTDWSC